MWILGFLSGKMLRDQKESNWNYVRIYLSQRLKAETPILWPPDSKNWLIWKDPDAGKDWRWEEKGTIEDEMVGWHHWLNGHEFEQTPGVGDRQGGLACCSPWGRKELDTTKWLNWTELKWNEQQAQEDSDAPEPTFHRWDELIPPSLTIKEVILILYINLGFVIQLNHIRCLLEAHVSITMLSASPSIPFA